MSADIGILETYLRKKRSEGHKLVVPYITGGFKGWTDAIRAAAANGVVLVTTKKGKAGKTSISLDVSTGYVEPTKYLDVFIG